VNHLFACGVKVALIVSVIFLVSFAYNPEGMPMQFPTNKKQVALTLDDGPHYLYTEKILDILKQNKVKASFFLIGARMIEYPSIVRRINSDGHTLGNHTYSHIRLDKYIDQRVDEEIAETSRVYENIVGFVPKYFRPPGGRINKSVLATVEHYGLLSVGWSINANDFLYKDQQVDEEFLEKKVSAIMALLERDLKPGAIILMHNGNEVSIKALPRVIEYVQAQGYQFVTLSEIM